MCGLAAKKGVVYAKDSIDFILAVKDGNDSSTTLWGFEAKGCVTASTAVNEEQQLRFYCNPYIRITDKKMFYCIHIVEESQYSGSFVIFDVIIVK